ncbi:MAG: serine/threonine protein kinase [Planctomycetota bacterium]|nr:serine/threonine protein kinase [Planctomycetota bacterium]
MNEETLFQEALSRSPEERAAFLKQACAGRPEQRANVERLLAAHELPDHILDHPPVESTLVVQPATDPMRADDSCGNLGDATEFVQSPYASSAHATVDGTPCDALPRAAVVHYFGDYEIQKELGRGGMGVVYKARQVSLNRSVALKMIKAGLLADNDELRRFQNEAEAVALLNHPGVVAIYEVGTHEGQRFFTMKLIEGGNLADKIAHFKENPKAVAALVAETADAVHHAHLRGILHRDLKPANILVDLAGHPHVTDFGLAKRVEGDSELTQSGAILGTPAYMSPEQASGRRGAITTATDVYGLGAILYALLTGQAPFVGDSMIETLDAVRTQPPKPPTKLNGKVPRDLELICLKCLEKNPATRYPTVAALADDLRHFTVGEPVSVRAAGVVERIAKWASRKPTLAAAYALGLLAALLGGLGGFAVYLWLDAAASGRIAETALHVASFKEGVAKAAKIDAETARKEADRDKSSAVQAKSQAETARNDAELQREKVANLEYGRTIQLAHQEWRENNVPATLEILQRTRSDLRGWEWYYVSNLCHLELMTLQGNGAEVKEALFSPDGTRIVTVSFDGTAKVWNADSGHEVFTLGRNGQRIKSVSLSRDGSRLVTLNSDGSATIWNAATGTQMESLAGSSQNGVNSVSFSGDGARIVATQDHTAIVWDVESGEQILTLEGHGAEVLNVAFNSDRSKIVTASVDGLVNVWNGRTGEKHLSLAGQASWAWCAQFSPDGSRIVTARDDGTARVSNAVTGEEVLRLYGHAGAVCWATYDSTGSRIATAGKDGTARIWDAAYGTPLLTIRGHTDIVHAVSFSPDGSRVVTASADGRAMTWNATTGTDVTTLTRPTILSASFSPDGSQILLPEGYLSVIDAKTGVELFSGEPVSFAQFGPDGSRIVTGKFTETARVLDMKSTTPICLLRGHTNTVRSGSYSTDGSLIVTTSDDCTAKVWDANSGIERFTLKGHETRLTAASFNSDDSRIVVACADGTATVWNVDSRAKTVTMRGHTMEIRFASFSPDGSRIVTASNDRTARVWDSETGKERLKLVGHTGWVNTASFSPDGSRIVTAGEDHKVKVWCASTGTEVLSLSGHTDKVTSASFSPNGSLILSASRDHTVKIWSAGSDYRELVTSIK